MGEGRESFDLQNYLTRGVEGIVSDAVRATLKNPKESLFMAKFAAASRAASKRCRAAEDVSCDPVLHVREYPQSVSRRDDLPRFNIDHTAQI